MSLCDLRDAVVTDLRRILPQLRTCETHGGRFDAAELRRLAPRTPAALVTTLALDDLRREHGEYKSEVTFAVFVLTTDRPGLPRDEAALAVVDALARTIPDNRWSMAESETVPDRLRAENLYSGGLDKSGVALWAVSWRQRMVLGQELSAEDVAALDRFALCDINHAPGPDGSPVAEDLVRLPQEEE